MNDESGPTHGTKIFKNAENIQSDDELKANLINKLTEYYEIQNITEMRNRVKCL